MENSTWTMLMYAGAALCIVGPIIRYIVIKMFESSGHTGEAKAVRKEFQKMQRDDDLKGMEADLERKRQERAETMKKFEDARKGKPSR